MSDRGLRWIGIPFGLLLLAAQPGFAAGSRSWRPVADALFAGEADGVAISDRGALFLAPALTRIGAEPSGGAPGQVWAIAADPAGEIYLATGPDGRILRIGPSGAATLHYRTDEPMVTALAVDGDGDLLAGTAPGGKIYRIRADGTGTLWSDTGETYVWALAVGRSGRVYAATGEQGRVLRIAPSGASERFFDSGEAHIVSLTALPEGGLLAGGAGEGRVYQIDEDGHAIVLHDDQLPEVTAVYPLEDGAVAAATIAPPPREKRRPAVRLRLPDGVEIGGDADDLLQVEAAQGEQVEGVIEGLEPTRPDAITGSRGRVIRIGADGAVSELWSSRGEAPFALCQDERGELLVGTGKPARLYRVAVDGGVALLATLPQGQLTALSCGGAKVHLATSNPGAAYRLDETGSATATYLSPAFDAGAPARWGVLRWIEQPATARSELYTRTGNSEGPDETWSGWSPMLDRPAGSQIVNPEGRYLQWRVRLVGPRSGGGAVSGVSLTYEPFNRAPVVKDFRIDTEHAPTAGAVRFRWTVEDPDLDTLEVALEYRAAPTAPWSQAARTVSIPSSGRSEPATLDWETADLPEGEYEARVRVTDQPSNPAGEARVAEERGVVSVTIDRTPPEITLRSSSSGALEVQVTDRYSPIARLELLEGDRLRYSMRSVDGVCDSRQELFRMNRMEAGDGWMLRAVDQAGNTAQSALTP